MSVRACARLPSILIQTRAPERVLTCAKGRREDGAKALSLPHTTRSKFVMLAVVLITLHPELNP